MTDAEMEKRGRASLVLVEALIYMLVEKQILAQDDVDAMFDAAVDAMRAGGDSGDNGGNEAIARLLERLQVAGDGVRLR